MWKWLLGSNKKTQPALDKQEGYIWLSQPYHTDLLMITVPTMYPSCLEYTKALVKINNVIKSGSDLINYMVSQDVLDIRLSDWVLDSDGCYHTNVPLIINDWREQCKTLNMLYKTLQDHTDYRRQCESKILVRLVKNTESIDSLFKQIRLN